MKNKNIRNKQLPPTKREISQRFQKLLNTTRELQGGHVKKKKLPVNQLWRWDTLEDVIF